MEIKKKILVQVDDIDNVVWYISRSSSQKLKKKF